MIWLSPFRFYPITDGCFESCATSKRNIENDATVRQEVRGSKDRADLLRAGPLRPFDHRELQKKGLFRIGVLLPELAESRSLSEYEIGITLAWSRS